MNIRDVKILIDDGEGFELEFKRKVSSPEKIAKTLSAFANTKGGIVLFGVDDDGTIIGVESEKSELDLIEKAGMFCDPPVPLHIDIVPYNHRDVIVASIEESDRKPHFVVNGHSDVKKAFIRVNDNSVVASKEVVKVLRDERDDKPPLVLSIGENERKLFSFLETAAKITVREFAGLVNVSYRRASRILTTLVRAGVIRIHTLERTDYFTLASDDEVSEGNRRERSRMPPRH